MDSVNKHRRQQMELLRFQNAELMLLPYIKLFFTKNCSLCIFFTIKLACQWLACLFELMGLIQFYWVSREIKIKEMILQFLDSDNVELRELDLIVFIFTNCNKMTLSDSRKICLAVIWIRFFYLWIESQREIEPVIKCTNKCRHKDMKFLFVEFYLIRIKESKFIKYMAPYYSSSVWNFVIFLRKHNKYN